MCWCIHCAGRKLAGAKHHLALGLPVPAIQVAVPGVGAVPPILSHSGAGIGPLDVLGVGAPGVGAAPGGSCGAASGGG